MTAISRYVITGGAGFIGSNFIRALLRTQAKCKVINLDLLTYAGNLANLTDVASDSRYEFVRGDVCDKALLDSLCAEPTAALVHFAAESHVDRSIAGPDPFLRTNVQGTQSILEAARVGRVERLIIVSTDEVYGSIPPGMLATEDWPPRPSSPYSASKAAGDLFALAYFGTYELPVIVTRCGNNYGPYQFPEKLIPLMITHATRGLELPLYGDGLNVRDWIHVEDHCNALLRVLERGVAGEVYNISARAELTNRDVLEAILQEMDVDPTAIRYVADRPGHDRRYAMNADKLQQHTGWTPSWDFARGLPATVQWYQEHREWWEAVITGQHQSFYDQWYGERLALAPRHSRPA
jgi:dTDP-glucose 4,6-dehydratase